MRASLVATYSRIAGVTWRWCPVRLRFTAASFLLQRFPEIDRQDLQRFPVLRYGAPCDDDALLPEYFRDLAVSQGLAGVFRADELPDERAYRRARRCTPGLGGDMA